MLGGQCVRNLEGMAAGGLGQGGMGVGGMMGGLGPGGMGHGGMGHGGMGHGGMGHGGMGGMGPGGPVMPGLQPAMPGFTGGLDFYGMVWGHPVFDGNASSQSLT